MDGIGVAADVARERECMGRNHERWSAGDLDRIENRCLGVLIDDVDDCQFEGCGYTAGVGGWLVPHDATAIGTKAVIGGIA
jgi:hypothetical protein